MSLSGAAKALYPQALLGRIEKAVRQHPHPAELAQLFEETAHLIQPSSQQSATSATNAKKRKLDDSTAVAHTNGTAPTELSNPQLTFECKDVSFQAPARKKLKLQLVADGNDKSRQEIRLQNQQNEQVEHTLSSGQIDQAFCLPVPEKQQRQWNFVLFPKPGTTNAEGVPCEPVVFPMNEMPPTGAFLAEYQAMETDTFVTVTELGLNKLLNPHGKHVVRPSAAEFASSIPQSHRKGEKAYHVKAHRGSKEGEPDTNQPSLRTSRELLVAVTVDSTC